VKIEILGNCHLQKTVGKNGRGAGCLHAFGLYTDDWRSGRWSGYQAPHLIPTYPDCRVRLCPHHSLSGLPIGRDVCTPSLNALWSKVSHRDGCAGDTALDTELDALNSQSDLCPDVGNDFVGCAGREYASL
jgi:hypothetical protein